MKRELRLLLCLAAVVPAFARAAYPEKPIAVVLAFPAGGGLGSGVVYAEDGLILTNHHCVRGAIAKVQGGNDWVRDGFVAGELTDEVLASVLDLLSGRYPSDEFAELRPRVVWDRAIGEASGGLGGDVLVGGGVGVLLRQGVGVAQAAHVLDDLPRLATLQDRHTALHKAAITDELTEMARSVRTLTDYLERNPNSLIFGKPQGGQ